MKEVIVGMSGRVEVDGLEEKTGKEVVSDVRELVGLVGEPTENDFVVVHDKVRNDFEIVPNDKKVGELKENCVVRVILPIVEDEGTVKSGE